MKRYSIGIDPGLDESGIVIFADEDEGTPLAWAVFSSPKKSNSDIARVLALTDQIIEWILCRLDDIEMFHVDIAVELPFARTKGFNPQTYAKQIRLIQEIESGLFYRVGEDVVECWLTEIYPTTSKKMACNSGGASKEEVLAASPFADGKGRLTSRKTLADAWAHALSTWPGKSGKVTTRVNLTELRLSEVKYNGLTSPR